MKFSVGLTLDGAVTVEVLPIRTYDAFAADVAEMPEGVSLPWSGPRTPDRWTGRR